MLPPSPRRPSALATPPGSPAGVQNGYSNSRMPAFYRHDSATTLSLSDKYSLAGDHSSWAADLSYAEADDVLHNPDPTRDRRTDLSGTIFTCRGLTNVGCLALLVLAVITLFAGYPIITFVEKHFQKGRFTFAVTNATGQVPSMAGNWQLIDLETPESAYTQTSFADGTEWQLVFSDEFNTDGRSFYPGDDPYWEAVNLHYWATGNMEWYDPAAITTANGSLEITLSQKQTHGLDYQGGMMSSWNKFCFTGGRVETSVMLPGASTIQGLWPAIWTMGNLGRAGYGATLDGMVQGTPLVGAVSQSAQWAPFNPSYTWLNTSDNLVIADPTISSLNGYRGGIYQQATSVVTVTNPDCYEDEGTQCYGIYGFEYKPGFDGAVSFDVTNTHPFTNTNVVQYISWIANGQLAWTLNQGGMGANQDARVGSRPIPQEPMYILMNLGQSTSFGTVDTKDMPYPVTMKVDYIRVYQPKDAINIGCDPPDFPTAAYINQYLEAYENPNLTTWVNDYGQPNPKNKFLNEC
ncbi:hypothetical protein HWV62_11544 [Athelia sp. TMB]|nr:hypothetical protein HWV62_11544 [Athelia sp. TMB]